MWLPSRAGMGSRFSRKRFRLSTAVRFQKAAKPPGCWITSPVARAMPTGPIGSPSGEGVDEKIPKTDAGSPASDLSIRPVRSML